MNQLDTDIFFMKQALGCAKESLTHGEIPVGAILVRNNTTIVKAFNQTISQCDPTAHAEVIVLRQAAKLIANHRLLESTIYVTLEPCLMCIGAMIQARIKRLVFGAYDKQLGVEGSVLNILQIKGINHHFSITDGLLANQSVELLKEFFFCGEIKGSQKKIDSEF